MCLEKDFVCVTKVCSEISPSFLTFSVCRVGAKSLRKWCNKIECLETDQRTPGPQIGPNQRHPCKSNPNFGLLEWLLSRLLPRNRNICEKTGEKLNFRRKNCAGDMPAARNCVKSQQWKSSRKTEWSFKSLKIAFRRVVLW